jgi:glycosyltransferase involved in cell wall biosynthesis
VLSKTGMHVDRTGNSLLKRQIESIPPRAPDKSAQPKRKWAINGDFFTLRRNGVARYAREVLLQLDTLVGEHHPLTEGVELTVICPKEPDEPLSNIPVRVVREFAYPRLPQFWVQMQLPLYVSGGLLSFCNLAPVACRRHIVCIHDLHTKLMPESYGQLFRAAHAVILPLLGRRAARVVTVSELARDQLVEYGVVPAPKIVVSYNGGDHARRWDPGRSQIDTKTVRPFAFGLGRPEQYKNAELLMRLAPLLDRIGLDLWIAGDISQFSGARTSGTSCGNVRFLGRVSDDDLAQVLKSAICFLFPSRIEGFGLPAIEAMTRGCPVIASTSPCMPEVCGDGALYADPDDLDAWLAAVKVLKEDRAARNRQIISGFARAQRYSWRTIAERYLSLIAQVDDETRGGRSFW